MHEKPLKTAVLGLDESGRLLLEAVQGLDYFSIVAVADSDTKLAQQEALLYKCTPYDDYRQLITQNQLDCLFVAAPIHTCAEYLRMALKKKFNILKLPPLARNFSEAVELAKLAKAEGVSMAVASPERFSQSAIALRNFMQENADLQTFFVLAASGIKKGSSDSASSPQTKWQSDPVLAGGGVILYDCWEVIDWIVWNFGVPQQVYCVAGNTTPDRQQRLYLTEDTATVTMKFSDALSGTLLAGKAASSFRNPGSPGQKWLIAQNQDSIVSIDDKHFEVSDAQGKILNRNDFDDNYTSGMKKVLENFGSNLVSPENSPIVCTSEENLRNMAVIEAAYLSARTGMPEEPGRILKIA
jgi:predicted dehydrogenase